MKSILPAFLLTLTLVNARKLPSYIDRCSISDSPPKLQECFRRALDVLRPKFHKGIPELQIPSLDPLLIQEATLNSGANFRATFRNITIEYAYDFQLKHLVVDLKNNHLEVGITFPRLRIRSTYDVDGKILIVQVKGTGPADGNFTNVAGNLIADGYRPKKNGKEYFAINKHTIDLNLGRPTLRFDNIFKDNPELNEQTNRLLNENIEAVIDELRPVINASVGEVVFSMVARVFNRFSIDELFTP